MNVSLGLFITDAVGSAVVGKLQFTKVERGGIERVHSEWKDVSLQHALLIY